MLRPGCTANRGNGEMKEQIGIIIFGVLIGTIIGWFGAEINRWNHDRSRPTPKTKHNSK